MSTLFTNGFLLNGRERKGPGLHALGGRIPFAGEGKGRVAEQWLQTRLMLDVCEPGGVEEIVTYCRDGEEIKLRACGMLISVSAGG
jgi:hypothetical protein